MNDSSTTLSIARIEIAARRINRVLWQLDHLTWAEEANFNFDQEKSLLRDALDLLDQEQQLS